MIPGHLNVQNGYYYIILNYYDDFRKRHFKRIGTGLKATEKNKAKAEEMLMKARLEFFVPSSLHNFKADMPFVEYLKGWLQIVKIRVKPTTYHAYETIIDKKIAPFFQNKNLTLEKIKPSHIQSFYIHELETVSPNTVIHEHAVIHEALKYAFKIGLVPVNVATKVDRPKKLAYEPKFLNAQELEKVFEAIRGTVFELPVLLAAFYGLRRGEVLGLKFDSIDFDASTITIRRTIVHTTVNGKKTLIKQESTKTKASNRTLPLVWQFREYFLAVKKAQEENKKMAGNCYNYEFDGYVFVDPIGNLIKPNYLSGEFPKFLEKHGLRRIRFHDLRHSCASLLLANGVQLKHIQEWLGHSDFSTTANIYSHLDYSSKISSSIAIENALELPDRDFSKKWEDDSRSECVSKEDSKKPKISRIVG